ncbi:class I SAM-dependent methyltransferase [Mycobacterium simiae]|uniref:Class I SAM-dependent methyltransferase n=1 Tax=Mycobacterium simiae TaxID=1784 RepID=A0A5B1BN80_MYCSI|nr:class I SAM-dependent methyltransferase [Mycobacterium simiae]KAA1248853.1 class I SAM-dependent methyltransferase [Mycobacterium simiae]
MAEEDRRRWDERYRSQPPPSVAAVGPPAVFVSYADVFPTSGTALDVACGRGPSAVWLARRSLQVWGLDISAVAIDQARDLAERYGVANRCRFDVFDLDGGLPAGPPADVVICNRFYDRRLYHAIVERLAPGGLLAIAMLSEVDAAPGPFRAARGELPTVFAELDLIATGEGQGQAWLLARA